MSLITERRKDGYRLRITVTESVWDRLQDVSKALGIEDREVLSIALALGVRYLGLMANPESPELRAALQQTEERELHEFEADLAAARQ